MNSYGDGERAAILRKVACAKLYWCSMRGCYICLCRRSDSYLDTPYMLYACNRRGKGTPQCRSYPIPNGEVYTSYTVELSIGTMYDVHGKIRASIRCTRHPSNQLMGSASTGFQHPTDLNRTGPSQTAKPVARRSRAK